MNALPRRHVCRFVLTSLFLWMPLSLLAQQSPYVLSARLGETISLEERAYFGLFSDVNNFVSATAFEGSGSKIEIRITTKTDPVTRVIERSAAIELAKYLKAFEQYAFSENFQSLNWLLIRHLVSPTRPYKKGKQRLFRLDDGTVRRGVLLYATEDYIILTRAPDIFSYTTPYLLSRIALSDIKSMNTRRERNERLKSFIQAVFPPIPRTEEVTPEPQSEEADENLALAELQQEMALYPLRMPPEIRQWLTNLEERQPLADEPLLSAPKPQATAPPRVSRDRFHAFISGIPASQSLTSSTTVFVTGARGTFEAPLNREATFLAPTLYVDMEYAFVGHLRLGINVQQHKEGPALSSENSRGLSDIMPPSEYLSGSSVGAFVTLVLNPIHRNRFFRGVAPEFTVRLGATYAQLETTSSIPLLDNLYTFTDSHTTVGPLGQVGLDLYFSKRFSFAVAFQARSYPNLTVPAQDLSGYDQVNSYLYGYASRKTYTAVQTNVLTGLRVHF